MVMIYLKEVTIKLLFKENGGELNSDPFEVTLKLEDKMFRVFLLTLTLRNIKGLNNVFLTFFLCLNWGSQEKLPLIN